ncbi:MAG: hypothetical protein U0V48_00355 [Anaerolineales bacterium]
MQSDETVRQSVQIASTWAHLFADEVNAKALPMDLSVYSGKDGAGGELPSERRSRKAPIC